MKNITAFTVLVIIILCARPVNALENYALSAIPRFGVLYGQAEEIVYPSLADYPGKGENDYLSQLLWDVKPVYYYGLDLDFSRENPMAGIGFCSTLSLKNAIPSVSGIMEDRDWAASNYNGLSDFSSHGNKTEEIFLLNASAGISLPLWSFVLLKTQLSFSYARFKFSSIDGYGIYARYYSGARNARYPFTDNPTKRTFEGTEISYTQEWFIVSPAVSAGISFLENFYFELSFRISPAIVCLDLDFHKTRAIIFKDYLWGGLYLEPGAVLSFSINDRYAVSLETSYRHIFKTRGTAYKRNVTVTDDTGLFQTGNYFFSAGEAGAGLSLLDAAILVKIQL